MKKKNLINFVKGGLTVLISVFIIFIIVKAAPPSSPYNPGATLDPTCAPGTTNCTVIAPAVSTTAINTTLPLSGGGNLSANRTFSLAGLSSLGMANYLVGVNSGATAWEYKPVVVDSSGQVGIGTTTPATKLHVAGRTRTDEFQLGTTATLGHVLTTNASGVGTWQAATGALPSGTSGQTLRHTGTAWEANSLLLNTGTRIGINTAAPGGRLVVLGEGITSATHAFNAANSAGTSILFVRDDGNVGIGTTAPQGRLEIAGLSNQLFITNSASARFASFSKEQVNDSLTLSNQVIKLGDLNTWTARESTRDWWGVAMSSDGSRQTAVVWGGQIFTNVNIDSIVNMRVLSSINSPVSAEAGILTVGHALGRTVLDGQSLWFATGGTERMRITPAGNVGIGTTAPTRILGLGGEVVRNIGMERRTATGTAGLALTVNAGGAASGATNLAGGDLLLASGISTGTGTSNIHFQTATAGATGTADSIPSTKMTILGDGNVGIGTATPGTRRLHIAATGAGAHPIATAWDLHSDITFKKNIRDLHYGLKEVLMLQPRSFNTKVDSSTSIGFIAQEIEKVIPEVVSGEEGQKGISLVNLTALLTKAIQEQQAQIEELKLAINSNGNLSQNGQEQESGIIERIKQTLASLGFAIENGIARVKELFAEKIFAKKVITEQLCIEAEGEQICIDKNQLKALLENIGGINAKATNAVNTDNSGGNQVSVEQPQQQTESTSATPIQTETTTAETIQNQNVSPENRLETP